MSPPPPPYSVAISSGSRSPLKGNLLCWTVRGWTRATGADHGPGYRACKARDQLPEEYQTIIEIIEDKLDDDSDFITIERIRDKILVKYDQMNKQSRPKFSRENENDLYVKPQYKGTCATCNKYGHKSKDFSHREGANVPKYNFYDKPGHVNK